VRPHTLHGTSPGVPATAPGMRSVVPPACKTRARFQNIIIMGWKADAVVRCTPRENHYADMRHALKWPRLRRENLSHLCPRRRLALSERSREQTSSWLPRSPPEPSQARVPGRRWTPCGTCACVSQGEPCVSETDELGWGRLIFATVDARGGHVGPETTSTAIACARGRAVGALCDTLLHGRSGGQPCTAPFTPCYEWMGGLNVRVSEGIRGSIYRWCVSARRT
jgi:hypothetical protein